MRDRGTLTKVRARESGHADLWPRCCCGCASQRSPWSVSACTSWVDLGTTGSQPSWTYVESLRSREVVENWLPQPPQRKAQFWTGSPLKPQDNMCTFLTLGALVSMRQLPAQTEALRVMSRGRDAAPSVFLKNPAKARQDGSKVPPGRRVQSQPLS